MRELRGFRTTSRHTNPWFNRSRGGEVVKDLAAKRAGLASAAQVVDHLSEEVLAREAAGHFNPDLTDRDPDLSADFEQP
jgi:hypothetical protein